jgi:hypothetical protein
MPDTPKMPDERELFERLMDLPPEEDPTPPGFESEQVEDPKDKPTLVVEQVKADSISVESAGETDDGGGLMQEALDRIVELLVDIRDDQKDGFHLG